MYYSGAQINREISRKRKVAKRKFTVGKTISRFMVSLTGFVIACLIVIWVIIGLVVGFNILVGMGFV